MSDRPYEWNPVLYAAAVGTGMAICTEHRGRHEWVMSGPRYPADGFCMGLMREEIQRRRLARQEAVS